MNLKDDFSSFSSDNFKVHYIPVFDLISMQNDFENCQYPEVVGKTARLQLNFT